MRQSSSEAGLVGSRSHSRQDGKGRRVGKLAPGSLACAHPGSRALDSEQARAGKLRDPAGPPWAWTPSWKQECCQEGPRSAPRTPTKCLLVPPLMCSRARSEPQMGPRRSHSPPQGPRGWCPCCVPPATRGSSGLHWPEPVTVKPQVFYCWCAAESLAFVLGHLC